MTDNVLYGIDFSAKRERDHVEFLIALSQAMATDVVFLNQLPKVGLSPETLTKLEAIFDHTYNGFPLSPDQRKSVIDHGHPYADKDSA